MKTRILFISLFALSCASALAQNIDTSVEVTNDFASSVSEFNKISIEPAFPDSLRSFDMNFNYDVFQMPYKAAYDFTPYRIRIVPLGVRKSSSVFYMKAGAGYSFHPVFDAVFSPRTGDKFAFSLYQNFDGYMGNYRDYTASMEENGKRSGRDLHESFGVQGEWVLPVARLSFNAGYKGVYAGLGDILSGGPYHSFGGSVRLRSKALSEQFFRFDVAALYSYATEYGNGEPLDESSFTLRGRLEPRTDSKIRFVTDFSSNYTGYYSLMDAAAYSIFVAPKVLFDYRILHFSVGGALSYASTTEHNHFWLYPDVRVDLPILSDKLNLYAGVRGGDALNSYSSLKQRDHFFHYENGFSGIVYSRARYDVFAGLSGSIRSNLQYALSFGRKALSSAPLDAVSALGNRPAVSFNSFDLTYLDLSAIWESDKVEVFADASLNKSNVAGKFEDVFDVPAFQTCLQGSYNIRHRIYLALSMESCSRRSLVRSSDGTKLYLPSWVDLGLKGEYKYNRNLSFWVKGGNLLGARIEKTPFVSRMDGPCFSLGLLLELR